MHDGPKALRTALENREPLVDIVVDAHVDKWERHLHHPVGRLAALQAVAGLIVETTSHDTQYDFPIVWAWTIRLPRTP